MKAMKKLLPLIVAVALSMVAFTGVAFAAGNGSITINNAVSGHTYTAYQIFAGDYSEGVLSNVTWGDGISAAGQTALGDAATKADSLSTEANAIAFADEVAPYIATGTAGSLSGTTYTIPNLEDGYYLVVDTYIPAAGETGVTYSRYMVQVVGNATVDNKAEKPTVDKKIVEGQAKVENSTANIGDTINYEITSAVPDMTGYKEYYMDFSDTLSKGLTYTPDSLSISIGGTTLAADAYTVSVGEYSATDGTAIAIHLKDFVSREYAQGAAIVITYSATVNDAAVIGDTGNPNTVKLQYSNNPADSGNGTPDDGNDGVKGETPEEIVKTFVTEIELLKVDGDTDGPLAGAVFDVTGSQINKVILKGDRFVAAADGEYYLLNDGTYTKTAPNDNTASKYAKEGDNYKRYNKEAYSTASQQEAANVAFQVVSGTDGIIKVTGLQEGTYTFTEIQAPDGYNLISAPITVVVKSNIDAVAADPTTAFAWDKDSGSSNGVTVENGVFKVTVENNKGNTLPSTGGMGTTILYIVGGVMIVLFGSALIARRVARKQS